MTLSSVEPVDDLLVTEGAKAVIDDIVPEVEIWDIWSILYGLAGCDVFIELPDTEKGLIRLQRMSFINGRVSVDNFQRVCMELRMQSSLEDGE